ncbi:hypothetical protein DVK02_12960 [Halobellus sp. Atlit-31R]|nr:hypothetical protein DVK02_12960 [Halobellus sp. Atlit-31R]
MVTSTDWMGHEWTEPRPLSDRGEITDVGTCVVRVWKPTENDVSREQLLTLIGTSETPISRLFSIQKKYESEMLFSVAEPVGLSSDELDRSRELEEVRYDLIGAHYIATGHPPRDQY